MAIDWEQLQVLSVPGGSWPMDGQVPRISLVMPGPSKFGEVGVHRGSLYRSVELAFQFLVELLEVEVMFELDIASFFVGV